MGRSRYRGATALFALAGLALFGFGLGFVPAAAQDRAMSVASDEGQVIMMPGGMSDTRAALVDGVNVSVGVEGEFLVYRAVFRGKSHVAHVALDGPVRHMAFDPAQARFREVLPSLLVELDDFARLDDVVRAVGGISGKGYEQLGFAIVRLPGTVNPAEAAQRLRGHEAVTAVQVQLGRRPSVPM